MLGPSPPDIGGYSGAGGADAIYGLAVGQVMSSVKTMQVQEIRDLVERRPFRPFGVRLSNGASYTFNEPKDVGAPRDYHILIYFGKTEAVRIDTESIVEVVEN